MATPATRYVRAAISVAIMLCITIGGPVQRGHADATTDYVVVSSVSVRSGPGGTHDVLGQLAAKETVSGEPVGDGWVKITFNGAPGFVASSSLHIAPGTAASPAAGTAAASAATISKGTATTTAAASDRPPTIKYTGRTTALLALRLTPVITSSTRGDLPAGNIVALTGRYSASYSQIVWKGAAVWILTGYLKPGGNGPKPPFLPVSAGKRYVTTSGLKIRKTSAANSSVVATVAKNSVLVITGKNSNGQSQVIFNGALRWTPSKSLTKTKPGTAPTPTPGGSLGSTSLDRTNAYAKAIVREIRSKFPAIKTMYGWRASSDYSSDHPGGRAIDIMIPGYKTAAGKALGDQIALYLQKNYFRLHIHYLIWRQRSWNVERDKDLVTGWRAMADRGGDTANHMDHVHVSVYDA